MLPNSCKCSDFFRLSLNKPLTINDLNRIQANSSRREVKPQLICTPLWDENNDGDFDNDGAVYHTHWVALREDDRVEGGFSVVELSEDQIKNSLPPTNPGMHMYMDSPGFSVVFKNQTLKVLVPAQRVHYKTDFSFDAVTAYMQVNQSDKNLPHLGVYEVYNVLSGDLSLPYSVAEG